MSKTLKGQALIQAFEQWVPKYLAFEGDRIGLQVGTLNKDINRVMVALDVLENVVDEAIEKNIDLIIAHHAIIFKPLKDMRTDSGQSKIVAKLIKHDIAVYVAHTNLDMANGGVNDMLVDAIGLKDVDILSPNYTEQTYKLVVYVPEDYTDRVRQTLGDAGAGYIGNYSHCTFNTHGTGTFTPQDGTNPFIGEKGKMERVEEVRMETIVPEGLLNKTLKKMIHAHPYEEPAYDVYPMQNPGETFGLGRIGKLPQIETLKDFSEQLKETFNLNGVRVTGPLDAPISKVAVVGGDGNSQIKKAAYKGADALITGDVYYHTAHDAMLLGLNMIDVGHHIEAIMKQGVAQFIESYIENNNYQADVYTSKAITDPFQFL